MQWGPALLPVRAPQLILRLLAAGREAQARYTGSPGGAAEGESAGPRCATAAAAAATTTIITATDTDAAG